MTPSVVASCHHATSRSSGDRSNKKHLSRAKTQIALPLKPSRRARQLVGTSPGGERVPCGAPPWANWGDHRESDGTDTSSQKDAAAAAAANCNVKMESGV